MEGNDNCFTDDDADDDLQEEDWTDTSWAQPTAHVSVIGSHKVTLPVSNLKSEVTATESTPEDPSMVKRMLLNDNKAGMEGLDKDKINHIIHEASKGSRFYENERKKEEEMKKKIIEQQQKIDLISEAQLKQGLLEADRLLEDFEQQRDLSRTIVHIDMDAFYAAVEMRDNPSLKNKPMAVGGTAMLSTSNYHARKFGVRAAMPGFIGKKLCPDLIIVPLNFDKYTAVSKQVKSLLAEYDPNFCPMSLDEAYLDITEHLTLRKNMSPTERTFICRNEKFTDSDSHCLCDLNDVCKQSGDSHVIMEDDKSIPLRTYFQEMVKKSSNTNQFRPDCPACGRQFPPFNHVNFGTDDEETVRELRTRIEQRTRLTASAGIAPNMMLSKVCSDKNKPNGQYKIQSTKEAVMEFIKDLPTRKISGIGKVSEAMLNAVGVYTCTDLYNKRALLYHLYSQISFNYFMRICLGIGSTTVERDSERKSMSTERTFNEISKPADLFKKCEELTESLVEDLKEEQLKGKTVSIKIKTVNFEVKTRAHSLPNYTSERDIILHTAIDLLKTEIQACSPLPLRLRLMGVRMSNLAHQSLVKDVKKQGTILGAFKKQSKKPKLTSEDSKVLSHKINTEDVNSENFNETKQNEDGIWKTDFLSCRTVDHFNSCRNGEQGNSGKNVEHVYSSGDGEQNSPRNVEHGNSHKKVEQVNSHENLGQENSFQNLEQDNRSDQEKLLSFMPAGAESVVVEKDQEVNNNEKEFEQACTRNARVMGNTELERISDSGDNWKVLKVKEEDKYLSNETVKSNDNMTSSNEIFVEEISVMPVTSPAPGGRRNRSGLIRSNKKPARKRRGSKPEKLVQYTCPICSREISCASLNDFNEHVDECLEDKSNSEWSVDTDVSEVKNNQEACDTEVNTQAVQIQHKPVYYKTTTSNEISSVSTRGENVDETPVHKCLIEDEPSSKQFCLNRNREKEKKQLNPESRESVITVYTGKETSSSNKSATLGSLSDHMTLDRSSESSSVSSNSHGGENAIPEQQTCNSDTTVRENTNTDVCYSAGDKTGKKCVDVSPNKNTVTFSTIGIKSNHTNCKNSSYPHLPVLPLESKNDISLDVSVTESGLNSICVSSGNSENERDVVLTHVNNKVLESTEILSAVTSEVTESTEATTAITTKVNKSNEIVNGVTSSGSSAVASDLPSQTSRNTSTVETSNKPKELTWSVPKSKADSKTVISNEIKDVNRSTFEPTAGCSWMADEIETTEATNNAADATTADLLVCPVCNVEQRSADLNEFNSHVDSCLSKGAISEILKEQKEVNSKSLKRERDTGTIKTPGSNQVAKKRKTILPNKPPSCKTILSFFKDTQPV